MELFKHNDNVLDTSNLF